MPAPVPARAPARPFPRSPVARALLRAAGAGVVLLLAVLAAPAAASAAGWSWPLPGSVSLERPFEAPAGPYGPGHRGVDLAAVAGSPVHAAADGTVVVAGEVAGVPVVVVAHGVARTTTELRTTYQPVDPSVAVGERVSRGDLLGRLAQWPGHCPADCLHWGLRRGREYLDPTALLDGPARLLPVGAPVPVAVGGGRPVAVAPAAPSTPLSPPLESATASAPTEAAPSGRFTPATAVLAGAAVLGAVGAARRSRGGARRVAARDGPGG